MTPDGRAPSAEDTSDIAHPEIARAGGDAGRRRDEVFATALLWVIPVVALLIVVLQPTSSGR